MRYTDFERIMSQPRMNRYLGACDNDTRKAMTLYRKNLKLTQELFTVISCFEVTLRNAIDEHYTSMLGNEWLKNSVQAGGVFTNRHCRGTKTIIDNALADFGADYTHPKLVASLGFGFWRYLFASRQYRAAGQTLIHIFPSKPVSTPTVQYNANYIYNQLKGINDIRNRLAHHDPICFRSGFAMIDTTYAARHYNQILTLFQWLNINERDLLYGLDHVLNVIAEIDNL